MNELIPLVSEVGFPIFVALLLLWDKMKTNGSLKEAVNNNTRIQERVLRVIEKCPVRGK